MAYNSSYTGPEIDSAIGAVKNKEKTWDSKQDKLNGTEDQLVGFNSAGDAVAVAAPDPLPSGGTEGQILTLGTDGPEWTDAPDPLPTGGTDGQVLTKTTDGAAWENVPSELPAGGTTGQVLTKTADGSEWSDAPSGLPDGGTEGQVLTKGESGPEWADNPGMTQAAADARYLQLSGGTMTGALTLNGNPSADNQAANKAYVDSKAPKSVYVTLSASGWSGNSQTVTVQGVKTSGQSVRISPATKTDADNWVAAGVWCSEPTTANQLVFTCDTAPTENININVELQEVQS